MLVSLAAVYAKQERYDDAEPRLVQVIEVRKRVLVEEHPETLISMSLLAQVYVKQSRMDEARPLVGTLLDF